MKSPTIPLIVVALTLLLCRMPILVLAEEPSLQQWFTNNGYVTNVATDVSITETFSPGHYRITILAEIADYAPNNTFGWYSTITATFHELFSGENTTNNTIEFSSTERFALYLGSPEGTFHTQNGRNLDKFDHAWVFQDPKTEDGYIIAWEDLLNGGDEDYQDMIIAMRPLRPPRAAFNWSPQHPQVKETVTFNASASKPNGGTIVSYKWNFGDDNTSTTDNPITTHVYHTSGNYTVTLNITDSEGKNDSVSHTITVRAHPHAAFTYSPPNPQVNEDIIFNASNSTPDGGYIISYKWNFGDDNTSTTDNPITTHVYHTSGNYTVTLNITDSEGKNDSVSHTITVRAHPHAAFTYSPPNPQVNEDIIFNASDSTPDGGYIVSYEWDFGDSLPHEYGMIVTHHYMSYGEYKVTLNVTDTEGKWDTESSTITIRAHPKSNFTYSPSSPEAYEKITFDASTSIPDGGYIVSYEWDFGDYSPHQLGVVVTHNYTSFGSYTVTLNVTDSEGKWDTESKTIIVAAPPHAIFTYSPSYPQVYETVTFDASDSTPDGGQIISYEWNFGDFNITSVSDPAIKHSYANPGNYTAALTVTDSEGKNDSVSHTITVRAHPHAAFTYSPPNPQVNEDIIFNASNSTPDGGYIISYKWNFGDDNTSTTDNPITTHVYHTSGNYTVTLNITDSEEKWDAQSKTIKVHRPIPESQFAVKIEDEWTLLGDEYEFTAPTYCRTFKVEVRVINVLDLFGYEFWLEFDPDLIQLTEHEIKHIHTEDLVTLEEIDNIKGVYRQAVKAKTPAETYNGSAPVAHLWFHIIKDPCYPYNYTSILKFNNTRMTDSYGSLIIHTPKHGYFNILSVKPEISIEHEGEIETTNWIVNETFTLEITIINIIGMKSFYIELGWCDCLETDYQNVEVSSFLPPPYELHRINMNNITLTVQVETFAEKPAINGTGTILRVTFKTKNPWGGVPPYTLVDDEYLPENYTCKIWILDGWIDVYCPEYRRMDLYNSSYGVGVRNNFTYTFTPVPGDLNLDGVVDIVDLSTISQWVNFESEDPEWADCYCFDLNGDECIDVFDVVIVATNFGRTHP